MNRAVQVVTTTGPEGVALRDVAEPTPADGEVVVDVHAIGVSFPDLLLSRGQYQLRPAVPFTLGADCAGTVATAAAGFEAGQRVAAFLPHGAAAERVAVPGSWVFPLPDALTFAQGAALPLNYLTAHFALVVRGQVRPGETVLVHGGAGGVGTACLQVARALGARAVAVVSTEEKRRAAVTAGADHAVLVGEFREAVGEITGGVGVDVVVDVVGGDVVTDSLRSLAPLGRLLVVGFAAGQGIPEIKVNRLLLGNIDVRGVGWGAYALPRPGYLREQWAALLPMIESGFVVPLVGATYAMDEFAQALVDMDSRRTLGKSVVLVRD
jgi:NADPH2:quinone reductase